MLVSVRHTSAFLDTAVQVGCRGFILITVETGNYFPRPTVLGQLPGAQLLQGESCVMGATAPRKTVPETTAPEIQSVTGATAPGKTVPGGQLPWGQLLRGQRPEDNCHRGHLSRGQLSQAPHITS